MLLTNMYVIRYCLFLNYLILFLQRYKKDKLVIEIKIKNISYWLIYPCLHHVPLYTPYPKRI